MALQSQTTAGWQQQITALKRQILELKDIIDGVLMAPSSALALPEPDKLDDITDYDIWIPYLTAKLELDKGANTSDEKRRCHYHSDLLNRKDLRAFLRLQPADLDLVPSLRRDFERWKQEPMTFFEGLNMDTDVDRDLSGYLSRQNKNAALLRSGDLKSRIRLRFLKVFFNQAESICQNPGFDKLEQRTGRDWASRGRTYNYLRRKLGTGCLFLLPAVVGDTV
ncbi:hypothetical protein F5883DRAFT_525462 [Diaporthe sp. PMI_573]|nr:hypothetical protein F5883DRAFT_525462 [Diaporthaceae sp. PMI_573]